MGITINSRHLRRVKSFNPCFDPGELLGEDASSLDQGNLIWVSDNCPDLDSEHLAVVGIPLWCGSQSGDGSGFGYGFGYGDGDGSGFGDGSGSGYGFGYGDGSGFGYGYGYGYGYGFGYGSGYGYLDEFKKVLAEAGLSIEQ